MNMFAKFDAIPALTLQDIKETKCYGRTHGQTDMKTVNTHHKQSLGGGGVLQRCLWQMVS